MSLSIYDTMSAQKVPFTPLVPGRVRVYVCGPTVYDMSHIGHARAYVAFDVIVRYLRRFYEVLYVRNYTDVDDKIIKRANELGQPPASVSERFISEFETDMAALGVAPADVQPKVTGHMPEILRLIEQLVDQKVAYAKGGDVYFAVEKFAEYGKLSKRDLEDMEAGARVEPSEHKKYPLDFALWKAAKPGEPSWDSKWGKGRPGWHIECSAMSQKYLGETFDIHGGGKDLVFPHHENEIAQSEAAHKAPLAKVWIHNGFVNVDNEKMSKSLGNFFTIRDVLQKFEPQALRYFLLTTHYRSPINFSDAALREAEARVRYIYQTIARLRAAKTAGPVAPPYRDETLAQALTRFTAAMDDDFNTAKALGDLSDVFKLVNDTLDRPRDPDVDGRTLRVIDDILGTVGSVLGLFGEDPVKLLERLDARRKQEHGVDAAKVEALIAARAEARKGKDFARADAIRKELADMGVAIKDGPKGTTWEMA